MNKAIQCDIGNTVNVEILGIEIFSRLNFQEFKVSWEWSPTNINPFEIKSKGPVMAVNVQYMKALCVHVHVCGYHVYKEIQKATTGETRCILKRGGKRSLYCDYYSSSFFHKANCSPCLNFHGFNFCGFV